MKKIRLGDVATYVNGYAFKPADRGNKGLPIIRIQDLTGNAYDLGFYDGAYPKQIEINNGDILISWSASLGVYIWNQGKALLNQHIFKVVFDKAEINKCYFVYAVKYNLNAMKSKAHGATMKHIVKKEFDNMLIPYPSLEEQEKIAVILSKVSQIIEQCQQALDKLDEIIKARFVEMFGDPRINPKGYDIVPISSLFDVGSSKRVFESDWREAGVPFYRAREIVKLSRDGYVDNELFIEESMYEAYKEKYGVPKAGDMMVTGVGTLGVCYIVKETDRFYFKDGNTLWFKNKGLCDVRFIKEQYDTDFVKEQITANANVSTVGTYTITNANNTLVLIPPLEEQEQYVEFCKQTDKSKVAVQKALDEAQLLFDSLMQQYFG